MVDMGIPPAIEPLINGLYWHRSQHGAESRDWIVRTVAGRQLGCGDALSFKLHQAEQRSKADVACSEAFKTQIGLGIGWCYVGRKKIRSGIRYKVRRSTNEIFWDWFAKPDLSNARYLIRRRWFDKRIPS